MDVDVQNIYDVKIEKVLKKLLTPNFKIRSDVYLNSLLTHIAKYQEKSNEANVKDNLTNLLSRWINECIEEWESVKQTGPPKILSFALTLTSLISKEESTFVKLNSCNIYGRFIKIIDAHLSDPTIKLGFITLLASFLEHKSGLLWIVATNFWTSVISFTLMAHTLYITSAGCEFIVEVLDKSITINESFCENVIKTLLDPLDTASANYSKGSTEVNDTVAGPLIQVLRLLTEILYMLLKRTNTTVMDIILNSFQLIDKIKMILSAAHTEELEFELRRVILLAGFADLYKFFSGYERVMYGYVPEWKDEGIFETLKMLIRKGYVQSVLRLCYDGLRFWRSIGHKMPTCFLKDQQIDFENQLMIIQIMPVIVSGSSIVGRAKNYQLLSMDDWRENFITKTLKVSGSRTIQAAHQWRNFLREDPKVFDNTTLCLNYMLISKSFYTREGGVMSFQAFIYCLGDIMAHLKAGRPNMSLPPKQTKFLETVLEATGVFIEEFNITWKDSIESIGLTRMVVDLFEFTFWTHKVVVKALTLLNITISKYMSGTMVLLVDPPHDSSLAVLGTLLYAKCHDSNWEVRDSSLEVLSTMSYNANTKFPSFQKIILDAELPHLVVKIARNDIEPFVRASALKCLQQMIQVKEFWTNLLKIENLHEQFFNIVRKETEGIVRKEAAELISKIYDHQNYEKSLLPNLYDIMTHAATADLYWEVKLNALQFWKSVVNRHLEHQGMIDGTFPKVTFSKETRKIVTLNDVEIKKRLVQVLNQLSETGCLAVFVSAVQDDCDVQVSKSATYITNDFVTLLKRYEVTIQSPDLSQPQSTGINMMRTSSELQFSPSFPNTASPLSSSNSSACFHNSSGPLSIFSSSPHNSVVDSSQMANQFNSNSTQSTNTLNSSEMDVSYSSRATDVTDDILEDILNSSDMHLLKTILKANIDSCGEEVSLCQKVVLSPSEFFMFIHKNLESYYVEKTKWLNGLDEFGSLLDDILEDYVINVNILDCY